MSEQITKDLGGITAYAAAVAAGYTGTKAQFETLMASYATVAQNAAASATAANGSAEDAEAFADGQRDGVDVGSTDPAYHNNAKYYAELAEDYAESIDPDTLAKIDGYYDTLGAGTAEQLTSNIYEEDNTPYNFRTSGGSIDIGDRETDMLVGGTVVWNQMAHNNNDSVVGATGITITNNGDGSYTFDGTAISNGSYYVNKSPALSPTPFGHVFFLCGYVKEGSNSGFFSFSGTGTDRGNGGIFKNTSQYDELYLRVDIITGDVFSNTKMWLNAFDLTKMFGTTIADYIYSLEQANAGAGVAWFKKLFPKDYYAYNAGELMHVQTSAHETVGFNQFDKSDAVWGEYIDSGNGAFITATRGGWRSGYIHAVPNSQYQITGLTNAIYSMVAYYNDDKEFISRSSGGLREDLTFTTPTNCCYIAFAQYSTTNDGQTIPDNRDDVCVHLVWDGERDGEYEAYVKHSYALDSDLVLRGIPKLDASNNLYYDGDTYESDGTVTRRYGIVDLGTLTWVKYTNADSSHWRFSASGIRDLIRKPSNNQQVVQWVICSKYSSFDSADHAYVNSPQKTIIVEAGGIIGVYDEVYADAAAFKTAMSGVYLVYELATPTEETADPYTNPQIVDDFGTEEYVDGLYSAGTRDVAIPVGHQTQYMANLKAKLEMSPSSPEGAGDYIVRQTNGENEYVTLASNATIQNIIARLEALEGGGE